MRALVFALLLAVSPARANEEALQRAFTEGMQAQQAGDLERAEHVFREMLETTDIPRVRLELARTLYLQGKYEESKLLFREVSMQSETPWRVRDNIALFVRDIEERTGYLKLGVTLVSDSNPGNLGAPREFSIGGVQVVPTQAPKRLTGARYSAQGWLPLAAIGAATYATASYLDYPAQDFDRLTADAGLSKDLVESGRLRGKAGLEFGTAGGQSVYQLPYLGLDAVIDQSAGHRLAGELKLGKVLFSDFDYLEATYAAAALSLRRELSPFVAGTVRAALESSDAVEQPYSYYGWDLAPGVRVLWPSSAFVLGASFSFGARKYADLDPLFGARRADQRTRLDLTLGNRNWRWRDNQLALALSVEENRSNLAYYAYRKANVSIVIE